MSTELDKTIESIRRDVLQRMLLYSVLLGSLFVGFVVIRDLMGGHYREATINSTFYALLIAILLNRGFSVSVRSWCLISLVYGLAVREFIFHSMTPDGVFFLMTGIALVAITSGPRVGAYFIAGTMVFMSMTGYLRINGHLDFLPILGSARDKYGLWIPYILEALLFCSAVNYMVGALYQRVVSEFLKREESLKQQKESEEKFLLVDQNSMLGMVIIQDDKIVHVNDAALKLVELPREEVEQWKKLSENMMRIWHPDDRAFLLEQLNLKQAGKTEGAIPNFEYRIVIPDGREKWIEQFSKSITLNGEPAALLTMMDISSRKVAELERQRLEDQIDQDRKMESIGRLAGGVAHDLNNLLTPILGCGDLLLHDDSMNDENREHAEQIVHASNSARELVQQLLAFSRKQDAKMESINFDELIDDFQNLIQFTLRDDVEFRFEPAGSLGAIWGDRHKLEQVVMNLIVNAQEAMPDGGQLTMTTATEHLTDADAAVSSELSPGEYVVVHLRDTGHGIDEMLQSKIFDPFFTTRGMGGTGLGLATVYGILKQHKGYITVSSVPDRGSTFTMYLPVAETIETHSEAPKGDSTVYGSGSNGVGEGLTVLLAEDNEQVNRLAGMILTRMGYKVLAATNGIEAIEVCKAYDGSIDLLLTDVVMPGMNGKELCQAITELLPDIKVVFMSGYADEIMNTSDAPLDAAFIQKPFTAASLGAALQQVCSSGATRN